MRIILSLTSVIALVMVACDDVDLGAERGAGAIRADAGAQAVLDPTQPGTCKEGAAHLGFASADFGAGRTVGGIGSDRRRMKPHSALASEFQRALGKVPSDLAASAATFGQTPARWYVEPTAGAVSLYTMYSLAFSACYETMIDARYEVAPTVASAGVECGTLQRRVWQRSPTPDEIKTCIDDAVGSTDESVSRRRWAYACASILTAAGFTTY